MRAFLVTHARRAVRAQPDLCGAVLGRHGHEGDIDDEGEGEGRVVKVGVIVGRLGGWGRGGGGWQGGVAGDEAKGGRGAEVGGGDLGNDWVWAGLVVVLREGVVTYWCISRC